MTIVMGLDQHRAQVTADWLDTETGEVSRARVTPADRVGVRRFLARFAGQRTCGPELRLQFLHRPSVPYAKKVSITLRQAQGRL